MFEDGACQHVNKLGNEIGWKTMEKDDWIYYPQQYINISMTAVTASFALVGGCCAPNRLKDTGFIYEDDGSTYSSSGNKIVRISDRPIVQNITVTGWYMKKFVDDHAMNLTIIPSIHHPDKQSIFYEIVAFDRAMLINYQFFDYQNKLIGNYSSGVLRNVITIPDITLPRYTRRISVEFYGSRADPMCFSYLYAGLYVYKPFTTLARICAQIATVLQYVSLINFILVPILFAIMSLVSDFSFPPPIRFLCRTPSHKILMCIVIMLGSFIFNQAWNIINSQSSIFHEWLPRAAKIVGAYTTCTLFGLRFSLDLPSYVITYARNLPFLIINMLAAIPTFIAYCSVLIYFVTRFITYQSCVVCHLQFLEVQDIEERYVKELMKPKKTKKVPSALFDILWDLFTIHIWEKNLSYWIKYSIQPKFLKKYARKLFGILEHIRIPFAIKTSLTLLLYCLAQLIPLLLTQLIGVGGIVPIHICSWSPYLSQFQYHPDPMQFAIKTFMLMQIAVYIATLGAGGFCMIYALGVLRRFTKDILRLRQGDYFLFKGKRNNGIDIDDSIRFLGVFIGFGFTGTLYFMLEISLIGTFITAVIQLDRFRDLFFKRVGYGVFFASFFIAIIVQMIQKRITNLIFIENRTRFGIQHRAPFLHYWYFMMLTSMTRALTSYILRTLKLIFRYPLFSLRVDRNAETWSVRRGDGGFTAYCGMLLAEHTYNNPIVLVFIECLLSSNNYHPLYILPDKNYSQKQPSQRLCRKHNKKQQSTKQKESNIVVIIDDNEKFVLDDVKLRKRRAITRWFLAYTLIRNPGLRQYRRREFILSNKTE
ncbi:retinol binding protein receptor-domain-containing protein [Cokeromyces recurvatus]|uniref:retinol binding protein receptor-domain-containing protein n=1 Tax=Cokeromyces recurvatus TaxID=90255 RepID=UPI00221FA21E|nr:retinol binding protein receptor-domain-containing protein [Cokeromyces recurvatus]KAI7898275.1 retinol binding protein receptor-domain-containing protein [Cokeromyces recurvatus]